MMRAFFQAEINKLNSDLAELNQLHNVELNEDTRDQLTDELPNKVSDWELVLQTFGFEKVGGVLRIDLSQSIKEIESKIEKITKSARMQPNLVKIISKRDYNCGESEDILYYVKATSKKEAIEILDSYNHNMYGHHIESDYDCTGQWFASPASIHYVKWSKSAKAYVVTMHWAMDV